MPEILIVDDEPVLMQALCETVQACGHATTGFTSGEDALAAMGQAKFDLLLTDLMMPGMDGITFLREALKADPSLVGIVFTGSGTIATAVEAMKAGAFDYILKPFRLTEIPPVLLRALAMRQLRLENKMLENQVRERTVELEEANKELETFSYSVAHDLRAPLRAVNGFSDALLRNYSAQIPPQAQQLLNQVAASGQEMQQLIDDLLRLSRLGRQPLSKRPINTARLIADALLDLRAEQESRTIDVQLHDLPDVVGDPALLKQVFINLLSNAFKFTRQEPKAVVEIGGRREDMEIVYFVRDNGAGFDMQYAHKLFGAFQRLHHKRDFEGTGIGLSIAFRIIKRHGGRIWAESEPGKGATFSFTLPG